MQPEQSGLKELDSKSALRRLGIIERSDGGGADVHESRWTWALSRRVLALLHGDESLDPALASFVRIPDGVPELGQLAATRLQPELGHLGLELTQLVVESIALPDEVAATLDQRTRIGIIGDVSAYAALQAADAVRDAARNPGAGGAGAAIGVGMAMAAQLGGTTSAAMHPTVATPAAPTIAPMSPPPIPESPAWFVAVDGTPQGPFEAAALRARAAAGAMNRDSLVWRQGMAQWAPASQVPEVASLFA